MGALLAERSSEVDGSSLSGDIVCERVGQASALTRVWATDPLKLLTPRTYGSARHVVISTYGGGLLGGDHVALQVRMGSNAQLVITTQSAGKVYRSEGLTSSQTVSAVVDDGGLLAVLPDPVCAFAGARLQQTQTYELSAGASLIHLDWLTSGRHGRGERWAMDSISSRTQVSIDGKVRLRETLLLDRRSDEIGAMLRVRPFDCYAVLVMMGPAVAGMIEAARNVVRLAPFSHDAALLATDSAVDGGAVFRVLGRNVQTVQALLRQLIAPLNDLIGQDPWARKW